MKHLIILLFLVSLSACTAPQIDGSIDIRMETSPKKLFPGGRVILFLDAENKDVKTYRNVALEVFDTGVLSGAGCAKSIEEMKPGSIASLECAFDVPVELRGSQAVWSRATFDSTISASQQIEVISQDEYDLRIKRGIFQTQAKSYVFSDNNMQLQMEFDESPPMVPGKKQFMRIKIKNIGNGLVGSIKAGDISVRSSIVSCPPRNELFPQGKDFPTIACEVNVPDVNYLSQDLINIDIKYSYDVREKIIVPR